MKMKLILSAVLLLMLTSCATMFNGSKTKVTFNSEPQGASVIVRGENVGVTPCISKIKNNTQTVVFQKEGFVPYAYEVQQKVSFWYYTNVSCLAYGYLLGSPILGSVTALGFMLVDQSTGSYIIIPKEMKATLSPVKCE
jgi:hypothetical protein